MDKSEWTGRVGDVWAEEWRRTDRSFAPVDAELVATAVERVAGTATPRILDVGCGAGTTSLSLAEALPDASITGVDLSPALIEVARSRTVDQPRCRFEQGDVTCWAGAAGFDLLVSRHGVMFFADPVAAFTHLHDLARAGGALVFSCFRSVAENAWASSLADLMPAASGDPHAPGPFAFADERRVTDILTHAGWRQAEARPVDYAYVAGEGDDAVADALTFFRRIGPVSRALRELEGVARERLEEALDRFVHDHHSGGRVSFPAAAWIWSAVA